MSAIFSRAGKARRKHGRWAMRTATGVLLAMGGAAVPAGAGSLTVDDLSVTKTAKVAQAFMVMGPPTVSTNGNGLLSGTFTNGLMAYYPFETGNEANDASGNGNTLAFYGGCSFDNSSPVGGALLLDGSTAWAAASSSDSLNLAGGSGVTVSAWVKLDTLVWGAPEFMGKHSDNGGGYQMFAQNWGNTAFSWWIGGYYTTLSWIQQDPFSSFASMQGEWHLLTATYDQSTGTQVVYLDDAPMSGTSGSTLSGVSLTSSDPLVIGQHYCECGGYGFVDGAMAQIAIWNRALDAGEVSALSALQNGYQGNTNLLLQAGGGAVRIFGQTEISTLLPQGDLGMGSFTNKP